MWKIILISLMLVGAAPLRILRTEMSPRQPGFRTIPIVDFTKFDVLVMGDGEQLAYEVMWNSNEIDGSYRLIIGPEQIHLASGHNNPNPNHIFWVTSSTEALFRTAIIAFAKAKKPFETIDDRVTWIPKPPHGENAQKNLKFVLMRLNAAEAKTLRQFRSR